MKRLILYIIICSWWMAGYGQSTEGDDLSLLSYIKTAMRFASYYPQEKVYLHLDNTGYFKGERIWFKAYVTRCDTEQRTDLSRVLYVELLTPSGEVVERKKVALKEGEGHGDIELRNILVTGFYEIRAYTRYMTNWGTYACFSRVIPIFKQPTDAGDYSHPTIDQLSYLNRLNNERLAAATEDKGEIVNLKQQNEQSKNSPKRESSVLFFPEGGDLVKGLPGRVAIMAKDANGFSLATSGRLETGDGKVLCRFTTDENGRGDFRMTSCTGDERVVVTSEGGKEKSYPLPEIKTEGCSMMIDVMRDDSLTVDLWASSQLAGHKVGYVLINKGTVVRCDTLTALSHRRIRLNRDKLPEGVSQFTLFDGKGRVLAERLFFLLRPDETTPKVTVRSTTETLTSCGKVKLTLNANPGSSLSFSAIDAADMTNGHDGDIRTWMLLGSELRGYVRHPWYYIESDDDIHRKATDLLMLIQGWRRYDWNLLSGQALFDRFQPIEDRLYLHGKARTKGGAAAKDMPLAVTLYNSAGQVIEGNCETDSTGGYNFLIPDIEGSWNLQFRSKEKTKKKKDYIYSVDRRFAPLPRFIGAAESLMADTDSTHLFRWGTLEEKERQSWTGKNWNFMLDGVSIKARRVWDRSSWRDETNARLHALICYDCDEAVDELADAGEFPPSMMGWLKRKNHFFAGNDNPQEMWLMQKNDSGMNQPDTVRSPATWFPDGVPGEYMSSTPPAPWKMFFGDGLTYKNRPIVWIIDNMFVTITGFKFSGDDSLYGKGMLINMKYCDNTTNTVLLPETIDELKCIYISEDNTALKSHVRCNEIEQMKPVVVYGYTHSRYFRPQKGVRRTYFQGYNIPTTFMTEDYDVVPPTSDDFRRTLYWNPNVKIDQDGKADVEFWNNSTGKEIYISVEGLTAEGKPTGN